MVETIVLVRPIRLEQSESTFIYEIMQQDSPVYAADITEQLAKQFAIRSGGRGADGCPIITFPEYSNFTDIPEEEFQTVIKYLTSIPSFQDGDIGFILLVDRRQDKWSSVKASLLRITRSFPGNLQLVLVLRPSGIFQRAISDIVLRFNRDDFKLKVPIIMLNSVTELHSHIDKTQLTQELGGTLEYSHSQWLYHRTGIESFAVMVKETAQMLQAFGTELAETDLPNDVTTTLGLITTHTQKRDRMKDDLNQARRHGSTLLSSIQEPVDMNPDHKFNTDELDNQTTVERLLAQLNETEIAFDEFWSKHQLKLKQCLQLRHFEQDFREVKAALDIVTERHSTFTEFGNSSCHVGHIVKDLCNFEDKSQEVLEKAETLAVQGDHLIEDNHYAVDSILPKCIELRAVCRNLANGLKTKKELLNQSMELHKRLEQAMQWCDSGIYLLASQSVDKCQSQDGAEAALQEIEKYLDTASGQKLEDLSNITNKYKAILGDDLMAPVLKIFQKQEEMEEMFEKRSISLKKLAAKQTRPVQPVAPRPEGIPRSPISYPSPDISKGHDPNFSHKANVTQINLLKRNKSLSKIEMNEHVEGRKCSTSDNEENLAVLRSHVMNELIETERAYVEELLCVLEGYAAEMENPSMIPFIPVVLQKKKDVLFGNMSEIYDFHNRIFLRELENYIDCPELVGRCFLDRMEDLQIYEWYCRNKPRSESLWRQCSDCIFFQECQKKLEHKLGLDSYLLKPVQRITKYQLLLKELLKYSKNSEGAEDLQEALAAILGILKAVNDSMHQVAITGYEGNLNELGKLLMQGSFNVWIDHKKGHAKVKDLARFKPMQRHLFLHEKALLFCKRREESGEGYEKAPSYSYKQSLHMTTVGITENVKGDNKKFEIWYNAREEVYIVQAATHEVKNMWVNEIRKVLTSQLEARRVSNQQQKLEHTPVAPLAIPVNTSPLRSAQKVKRAEIVSPENHSISVTSPKRQEKVKGWTKVSQSLDISEENNDGWSSADDQLNSSDCEEETSRKLLPGKYTVIADYGKSGGEELTASTGDLLQLIREGQDGRWLVRNLNTNKEGWVPATKLQTLIGDSSSSQSISSSESASASSTLSSSSSCAEHCTASSTSVVDIKG
ncbi:guanine nucleotide exchange factor DBS isoform X2 [Chiloscyllium plagiosum]|uniref:guanine nucleotide exchange factor DBS isoform X2 n=1 Tax=Chiloscyllium plagiosum TaxID=36176 RepID=UPI001CB86088|nr:guanine nucleotide exchange factor DBS isoform X2 [Chiloscyllium plagiosum]